MTLSRQLFAGIAAAFLVLMIGIEATYVSTARSHLERQLDAHANETATSLALSIGTRTQTLDVPLVHTMVNPVFDRGHFASIAVRDIRGEAVFLREMAVRELSVPAWFQAAARLEGPTGKALISAGWRQLGTVEVSVSPQYAYEQLWQTAMATFYWLLALFAIALLGMRWYLGGILRPLEEIERAASAISERDFVSIDVKPATRELQRVTEAMNSLSRKVREAISEESARAERLRKEAFEDTVTGELNRRGFQQTASGLLGEGGEVYEGALGLFTVTGLEEINREFGVSRGNEIVRALAGELDSGVDQGRTLVGRWQGPTLAVLLANTPQTLAAEWAKDRCANWKALLRTRGLPEGGGLSAGLVHFDSGQPGLDTLASMAQLALTQAIKQGGGAILLDSSLAAEGDSEGLATQIESAIKGDRISLLSQPALSVTSGEVMHLELMSRLLGEDGKPIAAARFIPVASHHGLLPKLDEKVALQAIAAIMKSASTETRYSINVSLQSVSDPEFRSGLRNALLATPAVARRIVFEMTGYSASRHPELTRTFSAELARLGSHLALDNFELDRDSLSLVHALRPAYVKIAPVYTRELGARTDVRFIVEALLRMMQPLEIPLIAQGVEDVQMRTTLQEIGVSGYQGFATGRPQAFP